MQSQIIEVPSFSGDRGNLAVIESNVVPFAIRRVFYIWGVPVWRGGHALKTCEQFLVPLAGSLKVAVVDGMSRKHYHLNTPTHGLYLPPLTWRVLHDFEPGSVCLVLASEPYDADGYYHRFVDFLEAVNADSVS